jgi:iron-sulfur cluster repair protein YtfE (RIC family)
MDLYQLLRQDHLKAKRLFERLGQEAETAKSRERLFAELKQELELHTAVEEKHFYPALRDHEETEELVAEALEEHEEVKALLADLDQGDKEEEGWAEQLLELQEDVEEHVAAEESEIFPQAQKVLGAARTEEIARAIEEEKAAAKAK